MFDRIDIYTATALWVQLHTRARFKQFVKPTCYTELTNQGYYPVTAMASLFEVLKRFTCREKRQALSFKEIQYAIVSNILREMSAKRL